MASNFQGPQGGPFDEALLPRVYQSKQQFSGLGGGTEAGLGIASKFLEGLSRGRIAKYAEQESKKQRALGVVQNFVQNQLSNPDLTDEYKTGLKTKYLALIGNAAQEQLRPDKGAAKSGSGQGKVEHAGDIARNILVGLTGGEFKGDALNPEALLDLMHTESDAAGRPQNLKRTAIDQAQDSFLQEAGTFTKQKGRAPWRTEISTLPSFDNLSRVIGRMYQPDDGKRILDGITGRFKDVDPNSPEARSVDLRNQIKLDLGATTPPPPGERGEYNPAANGFRREAPRFETALTPGEGLRFKEWKAKNAPNDSGEDYDLRGAFKAGVNPDPKTGHWPDTFKKPNHPTFSDQSVYAGQAPDKAGTWNGDSYTPPASREIQLSQSQIDLAKNDKMIGTPYSVTLKDGKRARVVDIVGDSHVPSGTYTFDKGTYKRVNTDFDTAAPDRGTVSVDKDGYMVRLIGNTATRIVDGKGQPVQGKPAGKMLIHSADGKFGLVGQDGKTTFLRDDKGKNILAPTALRTAKDKSVEMTKALESSTKHYNSQIQSLEAERARTRNSLFAKTQPQALGVEPMSKDAYQTALANANSDIDSRIATIRAEMTESSANLRSAYGGQAPPESRQTGAPDYTKLPADEDLDWEP